MSKLHKDIIVYKNLIMRIFISLIIYLAVTLSVFCEDPGISNFQSGDLCINKHQQRGKSVFLDEVMSYLDTGQYIVFGTGHRGTLWSAVGRRSGVFKIYRGNSLPESSKSSFTYTTFDTATFVRKYSEIFDWGFDSLPGLALDMQSIALNKGYSPFFNELGIARNHTLLFDTNSELTFSGPDSVNFKLQICRLRYLMYWLAMYGEQEHNEVPPPDSYFEDIRKREYHENKKRIRKEKKVASQREKSDLQ